MNKHLKLFSALLVLMLFAPVSMFVCPADAEAAQTLVENSWRYEGGQLVSDDASSEEDGIALLSMDALPDGVTAQGIDVSEHQGRIDWDAVKASGIDFAILRVGFGAPSFGGRVDYQFNRNISECERLGIPYGVYVYSYAFDNQQAADEASMVINCLSGHNPRLPVYYDLEDNSIIANGRQTGIALRAQVFCNRISAAGYEPGIYANLNWFNNILTDSVFKSSSWDHWIAQYNSQCDYTGNYSFWQYKSNGKVPGINGNVDMNYAYVDEPSKAFAGSDCSLCGALRNGKLFTSNGDGELVEAHGFVMLGGCKFYADSTDGSPCAGWKNVNGKWYFFDETAGYARSGWLYKDGSWFYLDPSTYAMKTGWVAVNGSWYYLNSSGYMQTGWLYLGATWYWRDASGAMATGWRVVDGSWNFFMANGAWVSDYMDAKAQSYSSNTNWLILVDTSRCVTSIYTGSWNNWSLNRRYVCSTGKASTPTVIGEYQVYGKGYSFGHGYTCYYYTQFYGDYLFHSSPYYVNSNRVMDPTMGVPSSAGCVRLEIQNAKWIYDNIPYGTKVVTY